ncbi:PREDICTED: uncharacterized protein LOC108973196 [Bactrocera latifrons]|uniref:uncharacterized protein LOC108973196 n=1 Tax=Bactrocera latifrons TaxID=174628 RepID=UPI0008DD1B76|nr:PREDICTED: uncharacterized protein LOC108973196 [Bactrocera latifrons]
MSLQFKTKSFRLPLKRISAGKNRRKCIGFAFPQVILLLFGFDANASQFEVNTLTFKGVCEQKGGDWCNLRCQIAGGRDGYCNKANICNCRQM